MNVCLFFNGNNFITILFSLCNKIGEFKNSSSGQPWGYKGSRFHRIEKNFIVQGGDFVFGNGRGRISIYGDYFEDENLNRKHDEPGLLSMYNDGPNTNGCQFFITCANADAKQLASLDNKYVVFGKLLGEASFVTLKKIEHLGASHAVIISECGEF